jgi:hypothetical protein
MNPARQRALDARRLPGEKEIVFAAMTACDCGWSRRPARKASPTASSSEGWASKASRD